jgi:hypothetical protein
MRAAATPLFESTPHRRRCSSCTAPLFDCESHAATPLIVSPTPLIESAFGDGPHATLFSWSPHASPREPNPALQRQYLRSHRNTCFSLGQSWSNESLCTRVACLIRVELWFAADAVPLLFEFVYPADRTIYKPRLEVVWNFGLCAAAPRCPAVVDAAALPWLTPLPCRCPVFEFSCVVLFCLLLFVSFSRAPVRQVNSNPTGTHSHPRNSRTRGEG